LGNKEEFKIDYPVSGVVFLSMTPSRPLMNFVADVDESHLYHPRWIKIMKYMMIQRIVSNFGAILR
jgi:hypothetical protein